MILDVLLLGRILIPIIRSVERRRLCGPAFIVLGFEDIGRSISCLQIILQKISAGDFYAVGVRDILGKFIYFQTITVYADVLAEIVASQVFTVHDQINRIACRSEFEAEIVAKPGCHPVLNKSVIESIGDQHPMLVLTETEDISLFIQLDLIWLLVVIPGGVSSSANGHLKIIGTNAFHILRHV